MAAPDQAFNYYLYLVGESAFYDLRINDVSIAMDLEGGQSNMTVPVNAFLKSDENTISYKFVSVYGDPYQYNVTSPDFFFVGEMQRLDLVSRAQTELTVMNLQLDAANAIQMPEVTKLGLPPFVGTRDFQLVGKASITDQAALDSGWGDTWPAREVTMRFTLPDDFPAPVWAKGKPLTDGPDLRRELLAAYADLHAMIARGDREGLAKAYAEVWQHMAEAGNFGSLENYIEKLQPFDTLAPVTAAGEALQPLDLVMGTADFQIQMMGQGRLVRIIPDPIIWQAAAGSDQATSTNVAFYRGADGKLKIGAVLY